MPMSDWYSLEQLAVRPEQLVLDRENPRLKSALQAQDERLQATPVAVQQFLRSILIDQEGAAELAIDFVENGFLSGTQPILVEALEGERFLVIEGNRRTAALQHLLGTRHHSMLPKSLLSVPVHVMSVKKGSPHSKETIRRAVLSHIHVQGQKGWGAYEKACHVYEQYAELADSNEPFEYDVEVGKIVAQQLSIPTQRIRKLLKIKRVYDQFRSAHIPLAPSHYTLVEMAVTTKAVQPYFGVHEDRCEMSQVGLKRFNNLCREKATKGKSPIHNPQLFRRFVKVYENANAKNLVRTIESGELEVESAYQIAECLMKDKGRQALVRVTAILGKLTLADFSGTPAEVEALNKAANSLDKVRAVLKQKSGGLNTD